MENDEGLRTCPYCPIGSASDDVNGCTRQQLDDCLKAHAGDEAERAARDAAFTKACARLAQMGGGFEDMSVHEVMQCFLKETRKQELNNMSEGGRG